MNGVVGAFLEISRVESGMITPSLATFPVADLLSPLRAIFSDEAAAKDVSMRVVLSSATIRSDPRPLQRMFGNLVPASLSSSSLAGSRIIR